MSAPPSLSSISSPQPAVNTKRTSQLPLPTSTAAARPRVPPTSNKPGAINVNITASTSLNSPRSPSGSVLSSPSLHLQQFIERDTLSLSQPAVANPLLPLHSSSTHAGGIQPSVSFFRPFRPSQQPYSRPPSDISASSSAFPTLTPEPGDVPLANLTKRPSSSFDDHLGSTGGGRDSMADDQTRNGMRRNKRSREALLPLSSRPVTSPRSARASLSIPRRSSAGNRPPTSQGRGGGMRESFEWVFKRGPSIESSTKSTSPGHNKNVPRTLEGKFVDEEQAYRNLANYGQALKFQREGSRPTLSLSPDPSYTPSPAIHDPPLSAVPVRDVFTGKLVRNYERHPSRNKFFFGGRLLTGGDSPWAFVASSLLVLGIAGVWFGTTCVWWWFNESPAVAIVGAYMCSVTISSMLATATRDPGILPRNLDPDPPYPASSPSDGGVRVPMPRDLKVRADVVRVKYCPTCKTYRPPRSSHCKMCDNCVDGCDHHCQWVNNCIGRRNYTTFFVFLTSATVTLLLVICTSALHLYLLTRKDRINFRHALSRAPGSAVAFSLSITVVWPVAALLSYHMRLLLLNVTTIEQIRNQAHKTLIPGPPPPNPFTHGSWRRNLMEVLCRPIGYSYLDGHGVYTEDKREPNPGVVPPSEERKTTAAEGK